MELHSVIKMHLTCERLGQEEWSNMAASPALKSFVCKILIAKFSYSLDFSMNSLDVCKEYSSPKNKQLRFDSFIHLVYKLS